jgi:hypothetical protein
MADYTQIHCREDGYDGDATQEFYQGHAVFSIVSRGHGWGMS